ncbi:DUF3011 domain-containing protein [Bdellovibrio sp. HCB288]|uniref:DUF3011 domain-containing protein n=1 Tax=Bdellovibrio sp. HCB288 TaxID=3394355 RepID=UPI0039B6918F
MKNVLMALIVLGSIAQSAHAYDFNYSESEEVYSFRGPGRDDRRGDDRRGGDRRDDRREDDRRPGNGPGYGRPGNGPGHGGPNPRPQPPPPRHEPTIEYVTCESQGNRYNTCYIDPRGIRRVYLARQQSKARCEENRSFGLVGSSIWVDHGCRGVFAIERF